MMLTPDMVEPKRMFHLDLANVAKNHTCVGTGNLNLTASQKELLKWHWKLAHISCRWIQTLMFPCTPRSKKLGTPLQTCILRTEFSGTRTCDIPICRTCRAARATIRGAGVSILKKRPNREGGWFMN